MSSRTWPRASKIDAEVAREAPQEGRRALAEDIPIDNKGTLIGDIEISAADMKAGDDYLAASRPSTIACRDRDGQHAASGSPEQAVVGTSGTMLTLADGNRRIHL
jgi:hypothetical protein